MGFVNPRNVKLVREALANNEVSGKFFPTVFVVEPASICNLSCVMCPNPLMHKDNLGFVDLQKFKKIIDDIAPYAEFVMLYWMGESLLHPDFSFMLKYARLKISGKIVVSTNMTVLNEELYSVLLQNTDVVICSLDRGNADAYEKIRRGAKFAEVVSNIETLLTVRASLGGAEVVVKALDLKNSEKEYLDFDKYWRSRGARPLLAWLNSWAGTFSDMRNAANVSIPRENASRVPCSDLWFKMVLNWQGHIQMCCFDWQYKYKFGDALSENWLSEVWQGKEAIYVRRQHLSEPKTYNNLCSQCDTWGEVVEHEAYINWTDESYFKVF